MNLYVDTFNLLVRWEDFPEKLYFLVDDTRVESLSNDFLTTRSQSLCLLELNDYNWGNYPVLRVVSSLFAQGDELAHLA